MIQSKADYKAYLEADRRANRLNSRIALLLSPQWKFLKSLRWCEYATNCLYAKYGFWGG